MTPTPTPTPVPGVNLYWDLQMNAPQTLGATWAMALLMIIVAIVRPRQRTLLLVSILAIITLPVSIINAGWWALTNYFFAAAYLLIATVFKLGD